MTSRLWQWLATFETPASFYADGPELVNRWHARGYRTFLVKDKADACIEPGSDMDAPRLYPISVYGRSHTSDQNNNRERQ